MNDQIRRVADRLAAAGFVALAPDLYHGELATHEEMDKAGRLMSELPPDRAARDMGGAVDHLREHPACSSARVGVVGFCMGGMLSLLLAAQRGDAVCAAAPFYGYPSGDGAPDWSGVTGVIRGHMAADDAFFGPDGARELEATLRDHGVDVEFAIHDAGHAFMNEDNALGSYDDALAARVWGELVEFLQTTVS